MARALPAAQPVWLLVVVLLGACAASPATSAPRAEHGVLDARGWDFARQGVLPLEGQWEFYWQKDLLPRDFAQGRAGVPMYVPLASWTQYEQQGRPLPRQGYGTYRLRVRLPEGEQILALQHGVVLTASELYLGGRRVLTHGRFATNPDAVVAISRPGVAEVVGSGQMLEIVVRVVNALPLPGGLFTVQLGRSSDVYGARDSRYAMQVALFAALLIIGLYHAAIYLLRRTDRSAFWLTCVCFDTALFSLVSGDMFIFHLWPGLPSEVFWRLFVLAWFGGVLFIQLFVRALFPDEYHPRVAQAHLAIMSVLYLIVAVAPMYTYLHLIPPAQLYTVFTCLYLLHVLLKAARGRREGAALMLAGLALLAAATVHDMLVASRAIASELYLAPLGLLMLVLCQAVVLATRFSHAFDMVEASGRARTAFFHNTSHELRTPLNGILGFVELLRRGHYGALESGARVALDKVARLSESLRSQVNTILDLAKSKHGKLQLTCSHFSLDEVVHEVTALADGLTLVGSAHARADELSFVLEQSWNAEEQPSFVSDKDKLLTVLRNLLGNAFKFREAGKSHRVTLRLKHAPGELHLEVEDTGIGVPRDQQARIFEEFVQVEGQASRAYEGTGLGLSLVKSYVTLLGGTISLDSEPGRGACFRVFLPEQPESSMVATHVEPALPALVPSLPPFTSHGTLPSLAPSSSVVRLQTDAELLVVDDNATNLEILRELLRADGHAVVTCSGGREALERLRQHRPDLVLLDLMMPEVSGTDVLLEIRRDPRLADLPVILLTARASQEDRIAALRLGADDYLAKPIDCGELLLRVRNTLTRDSLAREKIDRDQKLEAARAVQESLLAPRREFPCLAIEDYYRAAEQTGGDWFGYGFDEASERFYVVVGDVTGHGLPAAMVTGAAAGAFRALFSTLPLRTSTLDASLQQLAFGMNSAVHETGARIDRTMTMAFVCIDLRTGAGCHLNAGHGPIYLFGGERVRALASRGPSLGSEPEPRYEVAHFQLESGEGVFLHSDGLTENTGPDGRELSPRGLQKLLRTRGDLGAIKAAILRESEARLDGRGPHDDCCFVMVRWDRAAMSR